MAQGFKYAKLSLNEPRSIYYSGQLLTGYIECELSQPVTYSAITLTFIGKADVYWTEVEYEEYNGVRRKQDVEYSAYEDYFNETVCVSGGSSPVTLQPGVHKISFQFQIPHACPSSFEGERGSVFYKIVAYIDYPDPSIERDHLEKGFDVIAPLDFNKDNDFKLPLDMEFEEFYSCCCSTSPMNIRIHVPATGFCPGQSIPIHVSATNQSNVEVKKILFQLVKKICYHSKQPPSEYIPPEEVLQTLKTSPILSNSQREITYNLVVPDMVAINLENCSIIDVGYFLKVTVCLSGCNEDMEDEAEIWLGLVPLASLMDGKEYTHPLRGDLPLAPIPTPPAIVASPIPNNMAYSAAAIPNMTAYPNSNGGYPNPAPYPNPQPYPNPTPYPNAAPYPNSTTYPSPNSYPQNPYPSQEGIPLSRFPNPVGFTTNQMQNNGYPQTMPQVTPYPGSMGASYPPYVSPSAPPPI